MCSAAGEIVGAGSSIPPIFELFLQSGVHRPLLLSSQWTAMGTGAATASDGKIYVSVVFCTELNPAASAPAPPAPPPPPPPASTPPPPAIRPATAPKSTSSAPASAPTSFRAAPVAPAPRLPAFDEVFYRLFTGDLSDRWVSLTAAGTGQPLLGPSLFLSPAYWTIPVGPAIS